MPKILYVPKSKEAGRKLINRPNVYSGLARSCGGPGMDVTLGVIGRNCITMTISGTTTKRTSSLRYCSGK